MENRKDDVILTRMRIGHSKITHKHLLEKREWPKCQRCNQALTIKHIIVDCIGFATERKKTAFQQTSGKLWLMMLKKQII